MSADSFYIGLDENDRKVVGKSIGYWVKNIDQDDNVHDLDDPDQSQSWRDNCLVYFC